MSTQTEINLKKIENTLRKIETEEKILNSEKRVHTFKGSDAYKHLSSINIPESEIQSIMNMLIAQKIIVKASYYNNNKEFVKINLSKNFRKEDVYIWVKETSKHFNLLISVAFILISLALVMYQVWPSKLRRCTVYVAYPLMAFVIFLIVLGVIRLIIFCITFFTHSPGIWLFPNLFADVGFIESFIPLWEYHGIDTKPKKKED